jgi:CMP-N,N'-diacetyllegionaminic acid synthase
MKILAVIPARGGSKGVLRKNLREVCGRSLLAHALACAMGSKYALDVVVSTDSPEILEHARSLGYRGNYLRPSELAQDDSRTVDAVLDVLSSKQQGNSYFQYKIVVLLQPTSPLRLSRDLDAALDTFLEADNATSLMSVSRMQEHPVECISAVSGSWNYLVEPNNSHPGRQFYSNNYFFINGAIYICTCEHLLKTNSFIDNNNTILYEMPKWRGIDIDTEEDLLMANYLCKINKLI